MAPLLILLPGCDAAEDHSAAIEQVQTALVRDVAGSGEKRESVLRQSLAEYLDIEFSLLEPTAEWSAAAGADQGLDLHSTLVSAAFAPRATHVPGAVMPDEIVVRFVYHALRRRAEYLGMEIDGAPALDAQGRPAALADGYEAVAAVMEARALQLIGDSGAPLPVDNNLPTFRDLQNSAPNPEAKATIPD